MAPLFDAANAGPVGGASLLLGVVSLIVTVGGFISTLVQIQRAKTKTEAIEEAVDQLRNRSELYDAVKELERSLVAIESAMKFASAELWDDVYDYCETARSSIHKTIITSLSDSQEAKVHLESCHKQLSAAMTHIGRARTGKKSYPDSSKLRDQLLDQAEQVRVCQKLYATEIQR